MALAELERSRNRTTEALHLLQAEIRRFPQRDGLRLATAAFAENSGHPEIAIPELEAILKQLPNDELRLHALDLIEKKVKEQREKLKKQPGER